MADDQVLVLDAGSSSMRCRLVDARGRIVHSSSRPWTYLDEPDAPELARAFDSDACWQSVEEAIRECVRHPADDLHTISAIAVTSQRQSLVFLDERGVVIYAGPNTDLRAVFEGFSLDFEHGHVVSAATGGRPTFMTAPGKLAWFRDHRADVYTRIAYVLTLADWLTFKLTGNLGCERTLASESGLTDVACPGQVSSVFRRLKLDCPIPTVHEALSVRGAVCRPELGILGPVPVVTAGADTQCGLIGMGIVDHGSVGIVAGWSATVQLLSSITDLSPGVKMWSGRFQIPDLGIIESNAGDMGNSLGWLADLLFGETSDPYHAIDEASKTASVGSDGVSAYLGPQVMDASSLSMKLGGLTFPTPLSLGGPTRGQIARATLESFAYALRANLEQAEGAAGFDADEIGLGGGITRSPVFNRIVADVVGRDVMLSSTHDATAIGASLVARTAIGETPSLSEATARRSPDDTRLSPDPQSALEYEDRYHEWLQVQRSLGQMMS
jgi:xylulokinase/glycerol kinase